MSRSNNHRYLSELSSTRAFLKQRDGVGCDLDNLDLNFEQDN